MISSLSQVQLLEWVRVTKRLRILGRTSAVIGSGRFHGALDRRAISGHGTFTSSGSLTKCHTRAARDPVRALPRLRTNRADEAVNGPCDRGSARLNLSRRNSA